jgi:hypothetical protein
MATKRKATSWFKVTVEVTAKNIAKALKLYGEENREKDCPVALALRGLKLRGVSVNGDSTANATKGGKVYIAHLPKKVDKFITAFDSGKKNASTLKPLTFNVKFVYEED